MNVIQVVLYILGVPFFAYTFVAHLKNTNIKLFTVLGGFALSILSYRILPKELLFPAFFLYMGGLVVLVYKGDYFSVSSLSYKKTTLFISIFAGLAPLAILSYIHRDNMFLLNTFALVFLIIIIVNTVIFFMSMRSSD